MNPFADGQAPDSGERQQAEHAGEKAENDEVIFRNPGCSRADHVSELARDLKQDSGDRGERIGPDIPGDQKAGGVAERAPGPHVQPAFQRHFAIQVIDGSGHRQVETAEGQQPNDGLRMAETRGDAYPRTAHHREHL